ncbi:MAG: DUF86 domain-containing protein [Candidatus Caenarcaniphilales bacterium]|nr:DUF86 domain-containing protein [Candidatus Caenarcaniphilales bacterium]
MRDDLEKIRDILENINKIEKYYDENQFIRDEVLQAAMIHYLQCIGESCRSLSQEFKEKQASVSWSEIIAFRNFLVHQYFEIDLDIVSKILRVDIPPLKSKLIKVLHQ